MLNLLHAFAADPVRVGRALPGELQQRYGREHCYEVDEAWDEHLHGLLGAAWPCPHRQRLDGLVAEINGVLAASGLRYGRQSYGCYSDADSSLCRAAWCVVLHARPGVVVETGVAHGVTSRVVLEALGQNDRGNLWSIDLPHPLNRRLHAQTAIAVTDACRARWSYLEGSSRERLPPLVTRVGTVDLFIHDSLHTARNTVFELGQVAPAMPPGGIMLVDDIKMHGGFAAFARGHPGYRTIVCPSTDEEGLFGIAINAA